MIGFQFMDKAKADEYLPTLFKLLYKNMNEISPSGLSESEQLPLWLEAVAPAVQKDARQIVLIMDADRLIGCFQYYINEAVFMMEEIQLEREYWGSGVFNMLYGFLHDSIKSFPENAEAYALKENTRSQAILEHLGLSRIGENKNGSCFHYRGSCERLWSIVLKG